MFYAICKKNIKRKPAVGVLIISMFFCAVATAVASPPADEEVMTFSKEHLKPTNDQYTNIDTKEETSEKEMAMQTNVQEDSEVEHPITTQVDTDNNQIKESERVKGTRETYAVVSVVDGDTVKVNINGETETLRLIGIDTPESVHPTQPVECFGIEASNKAKSLLTGKRVALEADSTQGERDKYGRLLRYVLLEDGTNVNKLMISEGYAYEYTYSSAYKYQSEFKAAQSSAERNKKGLWADGACSDYQAEPDVTKEDPTPGVQEQPSEPPAAQATDGHTWYVSSHYSSKQYYCDTDDGWKGLSEKYLRSYPSQEALKKDFPNHTLHQPCSVGD